jgi:L-asparaginase II
MPEPSPPPHIPRPPAAPPHVALAVATRGDAIEAVHYGSVAVVDVEGTVLYAAGDPHFLTMTRSALKPLQAIPFVAAGGVERFGYTAAQVALLCASHSGEPRHVEAVADMLARSGSAPGDLQCGTHAPGHYEVRGETPPPPPWSPLAHNCSGKHSGMLAYCVLCGAPKGSYLDFDHPLQAAIRRAVAHFTGTPEAQLVAGIDGCSAPNYAVPLAGLARAYARLAAASDDPVYAGAPRLLAESMLAHPEMVSGEGRNDLALMRTGRGDWVTKIGAEGVQAIGVRSRGWGIAVKVADGAKRGLHPATVEVLDQLGLLDAGQRAELAPWREPTVKNYRGTVTGAVRPRVVIAGVAATAQGVAAGRAATVAP